MPFDCLRRIAGCLLLALSALHAANDDRTLNPLPNTVNIPAATFAGKHLGTLPAPTPTVVMYSQAGDLTGDGYPEIAMTGWTFRAWDSTGEPPPAPITVVSTSAAGATFLDPVALLGTGTVAGTTNPYIVDLNNDGRNDFFYIGHNESPLVPTMSERFIQQPSGGFVRSTIAGPKVEAHNSGLGDFNGDGFIDVVASTYATDPAFYAAELANGTLPDPTHPGWGYLMLYLNDQAGGFVAHPVVRRGANGLPDAMGSGSASAIGDLDGDGKAEIVTVDAYNQENNWVRSESFVLTNLSFRNGVALADLRPLPKPYFDRDDRYAAYKSLSPDKSHDIKVDLVDFNHDGRPDLVVSAIIWEHTEGTQAGVFQLLANQGNLTFTDVTDTSLYNFYMGTGSSHETEFVDVNGDGFLDVLSREPYGEAAPTDGIRWSTKDKEWANRILINAGNGKFVQAMWNEFRENTLKMRDLAGDANLSQFDQSVAYYVLPDGRLGYIARQATFDNTNGYVSREAYFDFRATRRLSTGPHASDPAAAGAPGYSEYFYLTEYPDVAAAVTAGTYASGLAHYLAVGRAAGRHAFAPNARIHGGDGVDTLSLPGGRADYRISPLPGGTYAVIETHRPSRLLLRSIERIQFADQVVDFTAAPAAWLNNVSVRTTMAAGQTLIVGTSVAGGSKPVLLRAAGPILAEYGLTSAMVDPRITLFSGENAIAANDDWNTSLEPTFARLSAFPFRAGSKDAALVATLSGTATVHATGTGPGTTLVEAYDAGTGSDVRLVNVSARNRVGTGADILIVGFGVAGSGSKGVLIRAIGPRLADYGVAATLANPRLELYRGQTKVTDNDDWDASLAPTFEAVYAFPLVTGSRDAALLATVAAGETYTVQVSGANGETGEALVEIYELP